MAEKPTITREGSKITETWEDGSTKTYTDPNYNPEPGFGPPKGAPKPGKNDGKKTPYKATPTPTAKPKGTQPGHAVTSVNRKTGKPN